MSNSGGILKNQPVWNMHAQLKLLNKIDNAFSDTIDRPLTVMISIDGPNNNKHLTARYMFIHNVQIHTYIANTYSQCKLTRIFPNISEMAEQHMLNTRSYRLNHWKRDSTSWDNSWRSSHATVSSPHNICSTSVDKHINEYKKLQKT